MAEQFGAGKGDVNISIGNVAQANNITVAGGDVMVNHNSQGNTVRHQAITVAGIPTTTGQQAALLAKIDELEKAVDEDNFLPEQAIRSAKQHIGRLRAWFRAPNKLNDKALVQVFRALLGLGQRVRGALSAILVDTLFEQALKSLNLDVNTFVKAVKSAGAALS